MGYKLSRAVVGFSTSQLFWRLKLLCAPPVFCGPLLDLWTGVGFVQKLDFICGWMFVMT